MSLGFDAGVNPSL